MLLPKLTLDGVPLNCSGTGNSSHCLATFIASLNVTLPWDPQELNLLDSHPAGQSDCIYFGNYMWTLSEQKEQVWLTPNRNYNVSEHCGSTPYGWGSGQLRLTISKPLSIPPSFYLICGDRAWQGIPRHAIGGPCYLGKLSLLTPSFSLLRSMSLTRSKRQISSLGGDCQDEVELWSRTARVFASLVPFVGTAQALSQV